MGELEYVGVLGSFQPSLHRKMRLVTCLGSNSSRICSAARCAFGKEQC